MMQYSYWIIHEIADKERELGDSCAEIKALKYSERLKEKAVEEVLQFNQHTFVLVISLKDQGV